MSAPSRHILEQRAALTAIAKVALRASLPRLFRRASRSPAVVGSRQSLTVSPPSDALVADYLRFLSVPASAYEGTLPPHLFPQWSFALASRLLEATRYPLSRTLNAGCRLAIHAPLPRHEPLELSAELVSVDDDGRRAVLTTRVTTSTRNTPGALVADLIAWVPLGGARRTKPASAPREKPSEQVPEDALELGRFDMARSAGLDFAKLTGDFNPIHWCAPVARAAGFPAPILHGFASLALTLEALRTSRLGGDMRRLRQVWCRFTRPVVLPGTLAVYTRERELYLGTERAELASLVGSYELA